MGRFAEKQLHQVPLALAQVATASVLAERLYQREHQPLTQCSSCEVKRFTRGPVGQVSDFHEGATLELDATRLRESERSDRDLTTHSNRFA